MDKREGGELVFRCDTEKCLTTGEKLKSCLQLSSIGAVAPGGSKRQAYDYTIPSTSSPVFFVFSFVTLEFLKKYGSTVRRKDLLCGIKLFGCFLSVQKEQGIIFPCIVDSISLSYDVTQSSIPLFFNQNRRA